MIDQLSYYYNVAVVELYLEFQGLLQISLKTQDIEPHLSSSET
jgi:hypothetical protein